MAVIMWSSLDALSLADLYDDVTVNRRGFNPIVPNLAMFNQDNLTKFTVAKRSRYNQFDALSSGLEE